MEFSIICKKTQIIITANKKLCHADMRFQYHKFHSAHALISGVNRSGIITQPPCGLQKLLKTNRLLQNYFITQEYHAVLQQSSLSSKSIFSFLIAGDRYLTDNATKNVLWLGPSYHFHYFNILTQTLSAKKKKYRYQINIYSNVYKILQICWSSKGSCFEKDANFAGMASWHQQVPSFRNDNSAWHPHPPPPHFGEKCSTVIVLI